MLTPKGDAMLHLVPVILMLLAQPLRARRPVGQATGGLAIIDSTGRIGVGDLQAFGKAVALAAFSAKDQALERASLLFDGDLHGVGPPRS